MTRPSNRYSVQAFAVLILGIAGIGLTMPASATEPGEPVDYKRLAFYADRWEKRDFSTRLVPWEGEQVVFLTTTKDFDPKVMQRLLDRLDGGWSHFHEIVGKSPRPRNLLNKKPTIAAVPDGRLTCGAGCGYVGATGIEVSLFYNRDYSVLRDQPKAFMHYYFYEMGRNYFVFGDRHSAFRTGFAVLMRYVCMDALKCEDPEANLRKQIESAEGAYAKSGMAFVDAFTTQGRLSEKQNRLRGFRGPSDQPVMYTSAMLKLRKDYGGDDFLKAFFEQLLTCPKVEPANQQGVLQQSASWLVSASLAAGQDLTPVFVDRWRMPLADASRAAFKAVDWAQEERSAGELMKTLDLQFKDASSK
ncbi:MAG: hypothetical protein KTR15_07605 [Phycisphaeraceae bacterium]|nr:hypothetical protein [Phycisphaeraceae bacterium]